MLEVGALEGRGRSTNGGGEVVGEVRLGEEQARLGHVYSGGDKCSCDWGGRAMWMSEAAEKNRCSIE